MKNFQVKMALEAMLEAHVFSQEEAEAIQSAIGVVDKPLDAFIENEVPFRIREGFIMDVEPERAEDAAFVEYLTDTIKENNDVLFDYEAIDEKLSEAAMKYEGGIV